MTIGVDDLAPGDSAKAAFAVVGAQARRDETEIKTYARRARQRYLCILGQGGSVDLTTDPAALSFLAEQGGAAAPQNLAILNYCADTSWTITHTSSWLQVTPASGRTPDTVTVSVVAEGLSIGTFYDTLVVPALEAGDTVRVPVTLQVVAGLPRLRVSRTWVSFEAVQFADPPEPKTIWIVNDGFTAMHWSTSNDSVWLSIDPDSGTVVPGDSTEATLSIGAPGREFVPGEYRDTITVTAPDAHDSPQTVAVDLQVDSIRIIAHNEPNPFDPSDPAHPNTAILLQLTERSAVEIKIYDLAGVLVKTLAAEWASAGEAEFTWDGRADDGPIVADGVYLCHLKITALSGGTREQVLKIAVLKK